MKISKKVLSFVISLALIIGMIPVSAFALGSAQSLDYPLIELNEGVVISTEDNEGGPIFSFVPAVDGEYVFFAYDSDIDTRGYILDENMEVLAENDDFHGDPDFRIALSMTAGTQYYLVSTPYYIDDSGEYTVKITEVVPATAIDIVAGSTLNAYVGQSFRLDIKFAPNNAKEPYVTWNSSNTDVATVSEYGYVEILATGTATITVTSENGLTDTIVITVIERPSLTSIQIGNGDNLTGYVGVPKYLWVNLYPDGAAHEQLTWNSDNESVATVNEEGKVEFLSTGTVTITVETESGLSDTCTINVGQIPTLTIGQPVNLTIVDNKEQYVKFVPTESGLFRIYVSDSSNDNEARITILDENMNWLDSTDHSSFINFEFEAGETYYIETNYCSYSGSGNGTYNLNAIKPGPATSISFDIGSEYSGYVGTSRYVNVIYSPEHAMTESITWSSSDSSIVSVSRYGQITLNTTGTATITATTENGLVFSCVVTVEDFETIEVGQEKDVALDGDEAYYYFTPDEDGYYSFYSYDNDYDTYGYIFNSDWEGIADDDDGAGALNFRVRAWLEAGETYILKAEFLDSEAEGSFKVSVEKAKYVTALEIVSLPDQTEYIEGWEEAINYYGLELKVTWSDASVTNWKYLPNSDWIIDGANVYLDEWNFEETGEVLLFCDEADAITLNFTIIENPVESIEVVSGKVTCIENTNGYEWNGVYYYDYVIPDDITIKINYSDETSKTVGINDKVDGYEFSLADNQEETPWVLGDDNYLTVSYLGVEAPLTVSIISNPVERIEINSAPTREYVYGDTQYGYLYSGGEYDFYPTDMTGLSFTVYYKDETNETFTYEDIDEDGNINGYGYELYYDECNPEIGDFPVEFMYMGVTANYTVKLKETTVSSIAVTKQPNRVEYSNSYAPDFIGMEITITYTDNSTKVITLTEDNLVYEYNPWWGELCYKVEVDGYTLIIEPYYGEGEVYFVARYLGAHCEIKDIIGTEDKEIDSIELDKVSWNGDDMVVKVNYVDDTYETLTITPVANYTFGTGDVGGFGKTENGLLYYYIETFTDASGKVDAYCVYILGEEIIVEAPDVLIGDVNSDGAVDNLDRLVLTRHLADWDGYGEEVINKDAADVNQDGSVDNLDRLVLTRHLANWEGYETLPMN